MQKLKIKNPDKIKNMIYAHLNNSSEARFVHRLHGILLLIESSKHNCESIGALFANSPRTISNWIHRLNIREDIEVLRDKKRPGRKPRLNKEELALVKQILLKSPRDAGLEANIWDGKTLSYFINKRLGKKLQVRQCQRLFHKLGFSIKRVRGIPAKADKKAKIAFKKTKIDYGEKRI